MTKVYDSALIGREGEQALLRRLLKTPDSEFVCVYGRRRVGKTFLVEETFADDFAFYATAAESATNKQQLAAFKTFLARYGDTSGKTPANWLEAFERLEELLDRRAGGGKQVVFLDELPWFDKPRSDFMVAFSLFWNSWASKRGDIYLIVCGSATSWIIEHVLQNHGDLFNRVSERVYLAPFTLGQTRDYLESRRVFWDDRTVLECHMIFGGLPYYLKAINPQEGLAENVTRLCFGPFARFRSEYSLLLESSFRKTWVHRHVLEVLSTSKTGLSRLAIREAIGAGDGGVFSRAIRELEECGYIRSYRNRHAQGSTTFYQLVDHFFMFALNFLHQGDYNRLLDDPPDSWSSYMGTPSYYSWRGKAFELVCVNHLDRIIDALKVPRGVSVNAYSWNSRRRDGGAQVDLVIECSSKVTYLCEMKCSDDAFRMSKSVGDSLLRKNDVFREETGAHGVVTLLVMVFAGEHHDDFDIGKPVICIGPSALFG